MIHLLVVSPTAAITGAVVAEGAAAVAAAAAEGAVVAATEPWDTDIQG
ncbi:MAG: hypothetical protein P8L18_03835 [Verrucomicrobiota bacterium]|nr:hypothetical protein [Verrucomicrobiota bacterium]